ARGRVWRRRAPDPRATAGGQGADGGGRLPARAARAAHPRGMTGASPARRGAHEGGRRTFEQGAYAGRAFAAGARFPGPPERRQAMRLAFGAVQRVRTVDHAMEQLAGRRPQRLQADLRNALRVSGYEVLFSDAVPARAAVSEGVELARSVAGARIAGLANAVLRRISEAGPEWVSELPPGLRYSYPDWVLEAWGALLGQDRAHAC